MNISISGGNKNAKWEVNNNVEPGFLMNVFNSVCRGEIEMINVTSVQTVNLDSNWSAESNCHSQSKSIGMGDNHATYHKVNDDQSFVGEIKKTVDFIRKILEDLGLQGCSVEFINYGDTELVYVIKQNNNILNTLLVGQPWLNKGIVRNEYNNLLKLKNICSDLVVSPIQFFENETREAYITPYFYQARCIASYGNYGVYIPEPYYRFESFSIEDCYLVTKAIVACLVRLYNDKEKLGIASCKIGGGDFILEKKYDEILHTENSVLDNIHLVSARELIQIELKDYLELLRSELAKVTYYTSEKNRDKSIMINHKNRVAMSKEAIEDGITLGLKLRK